MRVEHIGAITGTALPIRGDDIDTDRIIPARFLRSTTFDGIERHLFEDDRVAHDAASPRPHPVSDPLYGTATIMIVNANFGCGSSREHAPQAIRRRGIRAVLGESFSEIFFGNAVALGMPCPAATPESIGELMRIVEDNPSAVLTIDFREMRVKTTDASFELKLPASAREAFLDGSWDATGLLLESPEETSRIAERLPYVTGAW